MARDLEQGPVRGRVGAADHPHEDGIPARGCRVIATPDSSRRSSYRGRWWTRTAPAPRGTSCGDGRDPCTARGRPTDASGSGFSNRRTSSWRKRGDDHATTTLARRSGARRHRGARVDGRDPAGLRPGQGHVPDELVLGRVSTPRSRSPRSAATSRRPGSTSRSARARARPRPSSSSGPSPTPSGGPTASR